MSVIQVSKFTYTSTNLSPSLANTMNTKNMSGDSCIMEFFGFCKGGNFNIHIWAWFVVSSAQKGKSGSIYW